MKTTRETMLLACWVLAALALGALTWQVLAAPGPLAVDARAVDWMVALRSEPLTAVMRALHTVQGKLVAVVLVLWIIVLARRRHWRALALMLAMVPLGMLANSGLKLLVRRPRPEVDAFIGSHGFSYPSGHTLGITLFCGYLVIQAFALTTRQPWRVAALCGAMAVVTAVAFSRVYLGVHHPSDVLASVLLGLAWLGMCLWGERWLRRAEPR